MSSCLEYLEAVPWSEEEEANVEGSEDVLIELLQLVLKGAGERSRPWSKKCLEKTLHRVEIHLMFVKTVFTMLAIPV
jgi:hypothetical protein